MVLLVREGSLWNEWGSGTPPGMGTDSSCFVNGWPSIQTSAVLENSEVVVFTSGSEFPSRWPQAMNETSKSSRD